MKFQLFPNTRKTRYIYRVLDGLVVGMSASEAVGRGPWVRAQAGSYKNHHKIGTNYIPAWHAGIRVGGW